MSIDKLILTVSPSEHATILNALRFWQAAGHPIYPEYFEGLAKGPVPEDEVDDFIETINVETTLSVLLTVEQGLVTNALLPFASDNIAFNIFDMDTDGVEEHELEELMIPLLGIQSGSCYSVERNLEAKALLALLEEKWLNTPPLDFGEIADTSVHDVQADMFFLSVDDIEPTDIDSLSEETSEA